MLYAVGDIHGEREMLEELLARLPLRAGDRLVFVGDYVDRGPDSKLLGVVFGGLRVVAVLEQVPSADEGHQASIRVHVWLSLDRR